MTVTDEKTDKTDEVTDETTDQVEKTDDSTDENVTDDTDEDGAADLGDAGKQALDRMKAKWKAADASAKENAAKIAALEAKINGTEAEHQAETERARIQSDAIAKANSRLVNAEVRAAAKGRLTNPADAFAFLDLSEIEVGDDGEIDSASVTALIDDLLTERPYLAAQSEPRFGGSADAGARKTASPKQWTQADLDKATPAEILKANADGLLKNLKG